MEVHSVRSQEDLEALNFRKLWYDIKERVEGIDCSELKDAGSDCVSFAHLVSGLDVGYYGYAVYVHSSGPVGEYANLAILQDVRHLRKTFSSRCSPDIRDTRLPGIGIVAHSWSLVALIRINRRC